MYTYIEIKIESKQDVLQAQADGITCIYEKEEEEENEVNDDKKSIGLVWVRVSTRWTW